MDGFRFLKWSVYGDAKKIVKDVFAVTAKFPKEFRYNLGDQSNRAVISIVLNIAEGAGKDSDPDLNRFFNIAIGSANETYAALELAFENGLIDKETLDSFENRLLSIGKQLGGFKKSLK
ncbi:MAG: four helix bundle protein [bacterium]|nr:four helix bundle protein [bacterium]